MNNLFLSKEFAQFTKITCNRADFIINFLSETPYIKPAILPIAHFNHVYVTVTKNNNKITRDVKTIIAHYDRVPNTIGANDNSAAVFILLHYIKNIMCKNLNSSCNLRIIFTDGEEAKENILDKNVPIKMGSYPLVKLLEKVGIISEDIFVFDCMGRGTIPILQKVTLPNGVDSKFSSKFNLLYQKTQDILKKATDRNYKILPTGYSDNASFFACKIPCVNITMLPEVESNNYSDALNKNPDLAQYVTNKKDFLSNNNPLKKQLPKTWQIMHTMDDNIQNLTYESIAIFIKILNTIILGQP